MSTTNFKLPLTGTKNEGSLTGLLDDVDAEIKNGYSSNSAVGSYGGDGV
jgi:hypothetical protein